MILKKATLNVDDLPCKKHQRKWKVSAELKEGPVWASLLRFPHLISWFTLAEAIHYLFQDTWHLNLIWNLTAASRREDTAGVRRKVGNPANSSHMQILGKKKISIFLVPGPEEICNRTVWKGDLKDNQRDLQMSFIFCSLLKTLKREKIKVFRSGKKKAQGCINKGLPKLTKASYTGPTSPNFII